MNPKRLERRHRPGPAGRLPEPARAPRCNLAWARSSRPPEQPRPGGRPLRAGPRGRPGFTPARAAQPPPEPASRKATDGRHARRAQEAGARRCRTTPRPSSCWAALYLRKGDWPTRCARSRRRTARARRTPRRRRCSAPPTSTTGKTDEAVAAYKKAVELDPNEHRLPDHLRASPRHRRPGTPRRGGAQARSWPPPATRMPTA